MREDSTLTAPREGIIMRVRGRFRHPGRTGAAAVAGVAVAAAACLAVGSPAYGSQSPVAGTPHDRVTQAPALPGAQPISGNDRVYTADQDSNTVTVINPKTDTVLGTIPFGAVRMDTNADVLGAMYNGQIDVHGLGFSRDGRYLDVIDVTTNAVHVVDTATNKVVSTVYLGRAPHEGFFSPDGRYLWVAVRGLNYVAVIDWRSGKVVDKIYTEPGPPDLPHGRGANILPPPLGNSDPAPLHPRLGHGSPAGPGQAHPRPRRRATRYLAQPRQHPRLRGLAILRWPRRHRHQDHESDQDPAHRAVPDGFGLRCPIGPWQHDRPHPPGPGHAPRVPSRHCAGSHRKGNGPSPRASRARRGRRGGLGPSRQHPIHPVRYPRQQHHGADVSDHLSERRNSRGVRLYRHLRQPLQPVYSAPVTVSAPGSPSGTAMRQRCCRWTWTTSRCRRRGGRRCMPVPVHRRPVTGTRKGD